MFVGCLSEMNVFCFIFQKNKLADMAKAKRLNRNFYDIVEKAKWYVLFVKWKKIFFFFSSFFSLETCVAAGRVY